MYVVGLLVFWRNVLNVSNFYIKCKSILNKGGLFPRRVSSLGLRRCWSVFYTFSLNMWEHSCYTVSYRKCNTCASLSAYSTGSRACTELWGFYRLTWATTSHVNHQCEVFYPLCGGRWLMGDHCPPYAHRKSYTIHYLVVVTQRQCHPLNDNSLSFFFSHNGAFSSYTSPPASPWQPAEAATLPALSPCVSAIGWICQHHPAAPQGRFFFFFFFLLSPQGNQ